MSNRSERLLASFSKDIFYREILFTDLIYTPNGGVSEIELADLIVNLGDIILAIQLKERNLGDNSGDEILEKKWLEKKGKRAKEQIKSTIAQIRSGAVISLKNCQGQAVEFNKNAEIVPLIVFCNETIKKYEHVLLKHEKGGLTVNCISIQDYEKMCKSLVSPIEILGYLDWRKEIYSNSPMIDTFIAMTDEGFSITNLGNLEGLTEQYIYQKYGWDIVKEDKTYLYEFCNYVHAMSEHLVEESYIDSHYEVILFLAHLDRNEIKAFTERVKMAAQLNKDGREEICGSLRNTQANRVIFFTSFRRPIPTEYLLALIREKGMEPQRVLQVIVYFEDEINFRIDLHYWYKEEN